MSTAYSMNIEGEFHDVFKDLMDELDLEGKDKNEKIHEMTLLFLRKLEATFIENFSEEDFVEIHFTDPVSKRKVVLTRHVKDRKFSTMKEALEIIDRVKNYYPQELFGEENTDNG